MEENKNKNRQIARKKALGILLPLIFGGILGFLIGVLGANVTNKGNQGLNINILYFFISIVIGLYVQIIIHEFGHFIFGLLSGYQLVSFRVGSFTLVRTPEGMKIKRYNIPGTGGQCLMAPPKQESNGKYPMKLYNMGGILFNLIVSILCTIVYVISRNIAFKMVCLGFMLVGYYLFIVNGIPLKIGGIANDGYNVFSSGDKDPIGQRAFYIQLDINARLSNGIQMNDIPFEDIALPEDANLSNPLVTGAKILEYYWYMNRNELENAKNLLEQILATDKVIPLMRNMVKMERVFVEILTENKQSIIDDMWTKDVQRYIKQAKYDIHARRVEVAMAMREDRQSTKTKNAKEKYKKIEKNCPVIGELMLSNKLLRVLEETYQIKN